MAPTAFFLETPEEVTLALMSSTRSLTYWIPLERLWPVPSKLLLFTVFLEPTVDFTIELDLKFDTTDPAAAKLAAAELDAFSVVVPRFEDCLVAGPVGLRLPVVVCCAIKSCSVKLLVLWRNELCLWD